MWGVAALVSIIPNPFIAMHMQEGCRFESAGLRSQVATVNSQDILTMIYASLVIITIPAMCPTLHTIFKSINSK